MRRSPCVLAAAVFVFGSLCMAQEIPHSADCARNNGLGVGAKARMPCRGG
jgi:hypothetical protein